MEEELNIAAILNEKPTETKLWSPMLGDCIYCYNNTYPEEIIIAFTDKNGEEKEWTFSYSGRTFSAPDTAEVCLFPSKQMRDWSKFAWKKGDVLTDGWGSYSIFIEFDQGTGYANVVLNFLCDLGNAKINHDIGQISYPISDWRKASNEKAKEVISHIEKFFGGKLNLETLEIEHTEPKQEFKDGDIAFADFGNTQNVFIISGKTDLSEGYDSFISLDLSGLTLGYRISFFKKDLCKLRLATEEEKQQLFSALEKKGKRWNPDTKSIEDLPKKCEFKPFDKVLARNSDAATWIATLFGFYDRVFEGYVCIGDVFEQCIPYNDETKHLLGTTDKWKGGNHD